MQRSGTSPDSREICLEAFAAELASVAYPVALRHRLANSWLDLELDLWNVMNETVQKWELALSQPEMAGRMR